MTAVVSEERVDQPDKRRKRRCELEADGPARMAGVVQVSFCGAESIERNQLSTVFRDVYKRKNKID